MGPCSSRCFSDAVAGVGEQWPKTKKAAASAAALREMWIGKEALNLRNGAPLSAQEPSDSLTPCLSHETWITSFYLFARNKYVLEINEFQAKI